MSKRLSAVQQKRRSTQNNGGSNFNFSAQQQNNEESDQYQQGEYYSEQGKINSYSLDSNFNFCSLFFSKFSNHLFFCGSKEKK